VTVIELQDVSRHGTQTPLDAFERCLRLIERLGPALNSVVALNPAAGGEAAAATQRWIDGKPLSDIDGIPFAAKDNLVIRGVRSTWGSYAYVSYIPDEDELPIALLRNAGAVLVGKTNTPEFASLGTTRNKIFGRMRNPWDIRLIGNAVGSNSLQVPLPIIAAKDLQRERAGLRFPHGRPWCRRPGRRARQFVAARHAAGAVRARGSCRPRSNPDARITHANDGRPCRRPSRGRTLHHGVRSAGQHRDPVGRPGGREWPGRRGLHEFLRGGRAFGSPVLGALSDLLGPMEAITVSGRSVIVAAGVAAFVPFPDHSLWAKTAGSPRRHTHM
jgi:hypothetical protein